MALLGCSTGADLRNWSSAFKHSRSALPGGEPQVGPCRPVAQGSRQPLAPMTRGLPETTDPNRRQRFPSSGLLDTTQTRQWLGKSAY